MSETTSYVIKNVDALYPKINQTYKFDINAGAKGKSVPCDPNVDGAAYTLNFKMTQDQAKELYTLMNEAFVNADRRTDKWADKLAMPFHKEESEGNVWVGKTTLKGAYNKQLTTPPKQFDSKNTPLPDDFLLTSNSTVNISVQFVPYGPSDQSAGGGVSLRLRAVQVIKYVPMADRSPFDVVSDGFDSGGTKNSSEPTADELFPETEEAPAPKQKPVSDDVFDEPKVKKSNAKSEPKPKNDDDLGALLDEFDD